MTLADREPHLSHGILGYVALPTKKLLLFTAGRWQAAPMVPSASFKQVAFIPETDIGYVLTEQGDVFETHNNGETWQHLPVGGVGTMHVWQNAITWLKEGNQVVYYQSLAKK